jgi:hypothetical protein
MELLAYVNRSGQFVSEFQGIGFDTFKLKTNTNDSDLNRRVAIFVSQLSSLQEQYDSLIAECKSKTVESLEAAFKQFNAECRAKKNQVAEAVGMNGTWQQEKNRLANVLATAKSKLEVAHKSKPAILSFASDEEIEAWQQTVVKAETNVNEAAKNLREYDQNYSFYAAEVALKQGELKQMTELLLKMKQELDRASGRIEQSNVSALSELGLVLS